MVALSAAKNRVFADTFYYLALLSEGDAHRSAVRFSKSFFGTTITTSLGAHRGGRCIIKRLTFLHLINLLHADSKVSIVPASQVLFERGVEFFRSRPDKAWSLTDCISFVVETGLYAGADRRPTF